MNKIEAKRKELEEYSKLSKIFNKDENVDNYNDGRLEGFNLGVEMARKEFIELLNRLYKNYVKDLEEGNEVKFAMMFMELKQSLEEKTMINSFSQKGGFNRRGFLNALERYKVISKLVITSFSSSIKIYPSESEPLRNIRHCVGLLNTEPTREKHKLGVIIQ